MTVTPGSPDEARLLVALQDRLRDGQAREAFAYLHLNFARLPGCVCEAEAHGAVSSLRVREHGAWSYSVSTAQTWCLAYIRPPEYRTGRITLSDLRRVLPAAEDRGDDHLTVRLHKIEEAQAFLSLIRATR